jgi:hypothetical protein
VCRISKQDISRHLVKSKEKLKNKQVQIVFGESPANEDYLYSEQEQAITQLGLLSGEVLVFCQRNKSDLIFFKVT